MQNSFLIDSMCIGSNKSPHSLDTGFLEALYLSQDSNFCVAGLHGLVTDWVIDH